MFDFTGQNVLITGGTKGIGKAVAIAFLKASARVYVTYGSDTLAAESFKQENPENLCCIQCDVSDYDAVEKMFQDFEKSETVFHVVVNNAGIRRDSVMAMMNRKDWESVINVNLNGVYNVSKFAVMNMMQHRYGRIISITSPAREFGFEGQTNYSATKAGIVGLTRSLSKEVAKRKITVNCVSPGFIETDLIKDLPEELAKEYKKMVPMKRFGSVEEVSPVVLFLASREASYVTGSVFNVDGGL